MVAPPFLVDIHTPFSSFSIVHSLTQETLSDLYDKLSRKFNTDYIGERVGPGWLKYEFSDSVWNLNDDSDYVIFTWRMQQDNKNSLQAGSQSSDRLSANPPSHNNTPTLHLHSPGKPLPSPPAYCNPSYYIFQAQVRQAEVPPLRSGGSDVKGKGSPVPTVKSNKKGRIVGLEDDSSEDDGLPKFKKQFNRFHEENGVRVVIGSIGPVQNVRMLLKAGYRHVYISRKFAIKHSFLPADAAPGHYGYGGLVNIGKWPIKLVPSDSQPNKRRQPDAFDRLQPSPPSRIQRLGVETSHSSSSLWPSHALSSVAVIQDGNSLKTNRRTKERTPVPGEFVGNEQVINDQTVVMDVYLSEEPHFDVVLGRSFFEKRQVKVSSIDPTDVVCLDTGEKIECELVILKDGRGEIVTVT